MIRFSIDYYRYYSLLKKQTKKNSVNPKYNELTLYTHLFVRKDVTK